MKFFKTSTRNLLAHEAGAGVRHHVALSVVGSERMLTSGYFRAKIAQENLMYLFSVLMPPQERYLCQWGEWLLWAHGVVG
jgi:hypothetical protein